MASVIANTILVCFLLAFAVFSIFAAAAAGGGKTLGPVLPLPSVVGMNFGTQGSQKLLPSMVVDLLLENGISKVKLYGTDWDILSAFDDAHIDVVTAIPNAQLRAINVSDDATRWVRIFLRPFMNTVNIKYLITGNEPFSSTNNKTSNRIIPLMKYIHEGLVEFGLDKKVKISISNFPDVLETKSIRLPSSGRFRKEIEDKMREVIRYLDSVDAPIFVDIYPFYHIQQFPEWPNEFVFFDNKTSFTIKDGNLTYTNVFDVVYDAFVSAVARVGFPNMKVIVGQVGWATDANYGSTPDLAERFYKGFLGKMAANVGTPLRPGPMDVYIYNLLDENRNDISRGAFQRHWGIYKSDGYPKFKIDFSGQGRDIYPVPVTGLVYLPQRWCVFNGNTTDMEKVMRNVKMACDNSDCTSMNSGGSCYSMDLVGNVSYAFNMYFQTMSQKLDDAACNFEGLGMVVSKNASRGSCLFPLQIVSNSGFVTAPADSVFWRTFFTLLFLHCFRFNFL